MPGRHNGRKRARGDDDAPPVGESVPTTDLNNAIQKIVKRNLTKGEVEYHIEEVEGGYVAKVTTPKMSDDYDKREHSGETMDTGVEAKESAAYAALVNIFADEELKIIHDLPKPEKCKGEKQAPDAPQDKRNFRNAVLKIVRKNLTTEDIVWTTHEVDGGWQSTLTATCLPGRWKNISMVGEVCDDQTLAEHSAAVVGLKQLLEDPEMAHLHDRKKTIPTREQQKGKGKGAMNPYLSDSYPMRWGWKNSYATARATEFWPPPTAVNPWGILR